MSSPANKNIKTSVEKTTDNHKLVYSMTTADETADNKNFGGDNVTAEIGGDIIANVNIDDDASMNTDSNVDNKKTGVAGKKETYSSDTKVVLDLVSKVVLLSDYDAQWPKTPSAPSSSKTSITGGNLNVDDNHDAEDDGKEYSMEDMGEDANEVDIKDEVDDEDEVLHYTG
jgi:hypothetical protein